MIARQLPAYSPVTVAGLARAATALLRPPELGPLAGELTARYSAPRVELLGSGTQALQVAMTIALRRTGGAVALPAFQCYDLATAAVGADAHVVLYDVDPATLAPDLDSVLRALKIGARVVVAAPLYGVPVPWGALAAEVDRAGGVLIEDAAQGHGGSWNGRPLGSWGGLSVLSFGRGKGWCGGAGGALLMRNGWEGDRMPVAPAPGLLEEIRVLAQLKAQWVFGRPALYGLPAAVPGLHLGETVYNPPRSPKRMTRVAAAAIRAHREASDREAAERQSRARELLARLARGGEGASVPRGPADGVPGYLRLPVMTAMAVTAFHSRLGIVRSYPTALSAVPALSARLKGPAGPWPGAEELAARLATFPTHTRVTARDWERVADAVVKLGRS